MDDLHDEESSIFKQGLTITKDIHEKLEKTRINNLTNKTAFIGGTKEDILMFLKGGICKNLVNTFFNYKYNKCVICGIEKSSTVQLDRAHCNKEGCDRSSLLQTAIDMHYKDEETPILIKDILRSFIILHSGKPIFILCRGCHGKYDKKD
tara:strand:+ start:52 stop:501 length:450 start_codon:yes stop_codon:yes gene_type:complete